MVKLNKYSWKLFLLLILGVDWASGYAIAAYVMRHGVKPLGYAFWQSVGPLLLILVIQIVRYDLKIHLRIFVYSLFCGLFGIVIPNLLIYFLIQKIDSGILTVLANIAPLFTYILALSFGLEKFKIFRFILVITGVIGVLILIHPLKNYTFLETNIFGNYLGAICLLIPFSYAFTTVIVAKFRPNTGNVLNFAFWMLLVSSFIIIPLTLKEHSFYLLQFNTNSILIILEILLSTFGYILLFVIIKLSGAVMFSLVNAIACISGIVYAQLFFAQAISPIGYLAIFMIIIALLGLSKQESI